MDYIIIALLFAAYGFKIARNVSDYCQVTISDLMDLDDYEPWQWKAVALFAIYALFLGGFGWAGFGLYAWFVVSPLVVGIPFSFGVLALVFVNIIKIKKVLAYRASMRAREARLAQNKSSIHINKLRETA